MKRISFALLAALIVFSACNRDNDEPDAYGTFEATDITVSAQANGKILALEIEEGMLADSGKIVGYIDTTDLSLKKQQTIEQQNSTISRKSDLEAQIAVQEQNRENLLIDKRRLESLFKDGAATQKQLDDNNSALNLNSKQIQAIKTQFQGIDDQVKSMDQQIGQTTEAIRNSRIIIPVKGTILSKYVEKDEVATYGKPLFSIADLTEMTLRVYVSEAQLSQVKIGDKVVVLYDSGEKTRARTEGIVSWVSPSAEFTPKIIQTREERVNLVYAVKVLVKNDGALKIGMPGEIKWSK